jgi:hypothetical protein
MLDTNPSALAPCSMAVRASSTLLMQQIFTLGLKVSCMCHPIGAIRD